MTYDHLSHLPAKMKNLSNLTYLDLSHNALTSFPRIDDPTQAIAQRHLTYLNLSYNALTSYPESINKLIKLTSLNLSHNQITVLSGVSSSFGLPLTKLMSLNLSHNMIYSIPDDFFLGLNELTSIDLSYNKLASIPNLVFYNLAHLTTINLSHNMLKTLPTFLKNSLPQVTSLDLSNNEKLYDISSLNKLKSLTHLNISHTDIAFAPWSAFKRMKNLVVIVAPSDTKIIKLLRKKNIRFEVKNQ
jgi:Leucine-rich repeat (LRR) protein